MGLFDDQCPARFAGQCSRVSAGPLRQRRFCVESTAFCLNISATSTGQRFEAFTSSRNAGLLQPHAPAPAIWARNTSKHREPIKDRPIEPTRRSLACHAPAHRERVQVCLRLAVWLRYRTCMPKSVALQQCACHSTFNILKPSTSFNCVCAGMMKQQRLVARGCTQPAHEHPWSSRGRPAVGQRSGQRVRLYTEHPAKLGLTEIKKP